MLLRMTYPEVSARDYWSLLSPRLKEEFDQLLPQVRGLRFVHVAMLQPPAGDPKGWSGAWRSRPNG